MKKILVIISLLLTLSGCITANQLQSISSGEIGCAPKNIRISNQDSSGIGKTWAAECNNEKYYCSLVMIQGTISSTSCKKAQ